MAPQSNAELNDISIFWRKIQRVISDPSWVFKMKTRELHLMNLLEKQVLWIQFQLLLVFSNVGCSILKICSTKIGGSQLKLQLKITLIPTGLLTKPNALERINSQWRNLAFARPFWGAIRESI